MLFLNQPPNILTFLLLIISMLFIFSCQENSNPVAVNFGYLLLGIWNDDSPDNDVMIRLGRNMLIVKNY